MDKYEKGKINAISLMIRYVEKEMSKCTERDVVPNSVQQVYNDGNYKAFKKVLDKLKTTERKLLSSPPVLLTDDSGGVWIDTSKIKQSKKQKSKARNLKEGLPLEFRRRNNSK